MGKSGCGNSDGSERLGRKELAVMSVLWGQRTVLEAAWAVPEALSLVLSLHRVPEEPVWDGVSQLCSEAGTQAERHR